MVGVKCEMIGIGLADNHCSAGDTHGIRIAVVEKDTVALADGVAEKIAGLVVANAFPGCFFSRSSLEIVDGEDIRFGFEEPVRRHGDQPLGRTTTVAVSMVAASRGLSLRSVRSAPIFFTTSRLA